MPEIRTLTVPARTVKPGDGLPSGGTVGKVEVKRQYTYIDGTKMNHDDQVVVTRSFPTQAEQAEQQFNHAVRHINQHIALAGETVEKAKAELLKRLEYKDISYHGSAWEDYAMAQAEAEIWNAVSAVAVNRNINVVDAAELVRDEQMKRLISESRFNSGSTSMMSNTSEAIKSEVRRRFINDLQWVLL